jgi:hypothetical protein
MKRQRYVGGKIEQLVGYPLTSDEHRYCRERIVEQGLSYALTSQLLRVRLDLVNINETKGETNG